MTPLDPRARALCSALVFTLSLTLGLAGCGGGTAQDPAPEKEESVDLGPDWPQFRGPGGMAVSEGVALPTTWADDSPNIRWRTDLPGHGNSSPVVTGGTIFLTAIEGDRTGKEGKIASEDPSLEDDDAEEQETSAAEGPEMARIVMALDAASGELLWQTPVFSAPPESPHYLNTNAAPSPASDGESLWVYFGSRLAKLGVDGTLDWVREIDPKYSSHVRYGVASSPLLTEGLVVLYQDREWAKTEDIGWLAAFDQDTGEEVWRHEWSDSCCSYTTPILWERPARTELVVAHSGRTVGYDPATGAERWTYSHQMYQPVSTPSTMGDDILCVFGGAHRNKGNVCLRGFDEGETTRVEEIWVERRRAPETASPVLVDGRIFAITEGGVISAYDVLTGEAIWVDRIKKGKGFRSSLIAGDGKLYAVSTWGVTTVVATGGSEFQVLAYNTLSQPGNNSTPAVGGGCLLLRTDGSLVCIDAEKPEPEPETAPNSAT